MGAKERNVPLDERGRGRGDVWIWAAICADTKLIPCWHIGGRDANAAYLFMEDLASASREPRPAHHGRTQVVPVRRRGCLWVGTGRLRDAS